MTELPVRRLTKFIKRLLDVVAVLAIAGLILWPVSVAVMSVGHASSPETWGVDIDVYSGFTIDLAEINAVVSESAGVRDPVIRGKASLGLDTSSMNALYVFTTMVVLGGLVGLYILMQLRAVFASFLNGVYFSAEISARIRNVGVALLTWAICKPFVQYFGGQAILSEYALAIPGVQLHPAFSVNGAAVFIGLGMIVLSAVLNEADKIQQDQQLTI